MSGGGASGTVAILCGDPVVARIIASLLRTVGHESRPAADIPPEGISEVSLLFIAPGANPDFDGGLSPFEASGTPVLDLSGSSWPCRIEEIKDSIDAALSATVEEIVEEIVDELAPDIPLDPETETA